MLNEGALPSQTRVTLLYFFPAFFVFLLVPHPFAGFPFAGVDGSWAVGLHLAAKYHLVFGRDFAFTYGPLAVLRIRYPIVLSKYAYLLSDIYFLYILFTGFLVFLRPRLRPGPVLFLFACVVIGQNWDMEKWYLFLMLVFLIEFIRAPEKYSYLVHAAFLSLICFYIKVNTGLINFILLFLIVHYILATKRMSWRVYLIFLGTFFAALFLSSWLLNTDLLAYARISFHLMSGYEDVMYLPLSDKMAVKASWCAVLLWALFLSIYIFALVRALAGKRLLKEGDAIVTYLLAAMVVFVWYKNGFVRADDGHLFQFFESIGPFAIFLYIYTPPSLGKPAIGFLCWTLLTVDIVILCVLPGGGFSGRLLDVARLRLFSDKARNLGDYVQGFRDYDKQKAQIDSLTSLPNAFREAVGSHSADIVPTEISLLYSNGIRYAPRTIVQSYSAYDDYLDGLNAARYLSPQAPDYVFFSLDGTQDRFAWMDEGRTKLSMLARYRPVKMVDDQLLLQKEEIPRTLTKVREDTVHTYLGAEIPVEKGQGLLFSRILVRKDLAGAIRSLVYQPRELHLIYTLRNGDVRFFRALQPLLADGMILNKYVNSTPEFRLFLLGDGRFNEDVQSIRIEPEGHSGYKNAITMINTWYRIEEKPVSRRQSDSLDLLRLTGNGIPIPPLAVTPSRCAAPLRYQIEYVLNHGGLIRIAGLAIQPERDNRPNVVKVLAKSADTVFELPTSGYPLPAIPYELSARSDLAGSGFLSMFAQTELPPGNYQLGLVITDTTAHSSCYQYIDNYFDIPNPLRIQSLTRATFREQDSQEVRYNFDELQNSNDTLLIKGWAVMPPFPGNIVTNLLLINDTAAYRVSTTLSARMDIMAAFKDPGFKYSGFSVAIPFKTGPKGKFRLGIEKTRPDGHVLGRVITSNEIDLSSSYKTGLVAIDSLPPAGKMYGNFDQLQDEPDVTLIGGWALADTLHAFYGRMELILKGAGHSYAVPLKRTMRPDIGAHFNNQQLTDCGFSIVVDKNEMAPGRYQVGLCLRPEKAPAFIKLFGKYIEKK